MNRRDSSYGAGTVDQMSSGRWRARRRIDGRYVSLGTFDTRDAAEDALAADVMIVAESDTVADYTRRYLTLGRTRWAARTVELYEWYAERKIIPGIGHLHLHEVTQDVVDRWWVALVDATGTGKNSGASTCAKVWRLLRQILAAADRDGLILHPIGPPVPGAGRERAERRPTLTATQVAAIIDHLPADRQIVAVLAATCGLRFGEIAALRVGDIDFDAPLITVRSAITEPLRSAGKPDGGRVRKGPKSEAGNRTIPLHPATADVLAAHIERHAPGSRHSRPLVANSNGGTLGRTSWGKQWRRAVRHAELEHLSPHLHDLRHYALTVAARSGSIRELMALGGHASSAAAMRYQHLARDDLAHLAAPPPVA